MMGSEKEDETNLSKSVLSYGSAPTVNGVYSGV